MKTMTWFFLLFFATFISFAQQFQTKIGGHEYTLEVPDYLKQTFDLNDVASLQYKNILKGVDPIFDLILVDNVLTGSEYLNRLLRNEKHRAKKGFFDYLKNSEIRDALICAYDFLKEERISGEEFRDKSSQIELLETEKRVADYITKIV